MTNWFKSFTKLAGLCISMLVLLFPSGCSAPSLNKAYTAQTLEHVDGLEGEWVQVVKPGDEPDVMLAIAASDASLYKVEVRTLKPKSDETVPPQHILVGMTKVNGKLFADATADIEREPLLKHYRDYLMPVHVFARVTFDGSTLAISPLSGGALEKLLKDNPTLIAHTNADEGLVLTAQTSQVREFLGAQHANAELFPPEPMHFRRTSAK